MLASDIGWEVLICLYDFFCTITLKIVGLFDFCIKQKICKRVAVYDKRKISLYLKVMILVKLSYPLKRFTVDRLFALENFLSD